MKSLNDGKDFYDPEKASSSGLSHVPSQPSRMSSLGGMISRDFCLPHNPRIQWVLLETFFEDLPVQEGPSSGFENTRNLASSSCLLRPSNTGNALKHGEGLRREPQSSAMPAPPFSRTPCRRELRKERQEKSRCWRNRSQHVWCQET